MINSPLPSPLPEGEGIKQRTCLGFFITGTDTGVGKTRITLAVMRTLQQQGLRVAAMKPVAVGMANLSPSLHLIRFPSPSGGGLGRGDQNFYRLST